MSFFYDYQSHGPRAIENQAPVNRQGFLRPGTIVRLLSLGIFLVVLCLFYIWTRVQIVQLSYEINKYQSEQDDLNDQNKNLRMELELMKSAQRITHIAAQKLKMTQPSLDRISRVQQHVR